MKRLNILFLLIASCIVVSCTNSSEENQIGNIDSVKSEISIKNWKLIGPFAFKTLHKKGDKSWLFDADYDLFKKYYYGQSGLNAFPFTPYTQSTGYADLNTALKTNNAHSAFAYCEINSAKDQDVAFLLGVDNNATLWVNDELKLVASSGNITRDEYPVKVHLEQGRNLVVLAISSPKDAFGFHLDVAPVSRIKRYAFGLNYFSISNHYLVKKDHPLLLRLSHPDFFDTSKAATIQIANDTGNIVLSKHYPNGGRWNIALGGLNQGVYSCRLITGRDTFNQKFIYGNYKYVFDNICHSFPTGLPEREKINIQTLINRFIYLDKFSAKNGYNEVEERKMSGIAFELAQMSCRLKQEQSIFKFKPGFNIRTYRSAIDGVNNNYAVYYPENYRPDARLPMVMIMPWVAKQYPFTESWHLAFEDRIEFLEMLARRYGFVIMWQSARIYEKYNLNPVVASTVFEAQKDLEQDYNIDPGKIYLYGTCSGGLQALLMANRFPSLFAAVGVEGPEISYTECESGNCSYPAIWTRNNSILNTACNYAHIPLYIANSKNDWHGAKEPEISQLLKNIRAANGHVKFDSINNDTRSFFVKMVNDNVVTDDIFKFFSNKKRSTPDTVKFATYQLKYNKAYWITIDDIAKDGLATIDGWKDSKNAIHITSSNVKGFSIDLNGIPGLDKQTEPRFFVNGAIVKPESHNGSRLSFTVIKEKTGSIRKTHLTEGPVSDFFSNRFILVKSGKRNTALADTFINNWKYNFFGPCISKPESEITKADIAQNNILLTALDYSSPQIRAILNRLPVTINKDYIKIDGKKITGNNLSFVMIYPDPAAPGHYVLLASHNSPIDWPQRLNNIALKGFYDVMVWDSKTHAVVYSGNFDRDWRLRR